MTSCSASNSLPEKSLCILSNYDVANANNQEQQSTNLSLRKCFVVLKFFVIKYLSCDILFAVEEAGHCLILFCAAFTHAGLTIRYRTENL